MSIFSSINNFFTPDSEIDFQAALREQDYAKAAWLFQKAVDGGHIKAKYFLAQAYLMGRGVSKDREKAMTLLRESATAGYEKAKVLISDVENGRW